MATMNQIAANLLNALKSTGPRTEAGKKRASLNALKHGCTAQTIILPGEDTKHFTKFHQSYIQDLAPKGALEESLVQELAHTQWAIQRIRSHEATLFAIGHEKNAEQIDASGDQIIQTAFASVVTFKAEAEAIKNIGLYLQRQNRMFHTTLATLREIQATRIAREQATLQETVLLATAHELLKIPFVPEKFGFVCSTEEIAPLVQRELFRERISKSKKYADLRHFEVTTAGNGLA